jgi:uncharacterized protein (TIGR02145 family)
LKYDPSSDATVTDTKLLQSACIPNIENSCEIYGRFYTWQTARATTSTDQLVQGLCPTGWAVPKLETYKELYTFAWYHTLKNSSSVNRKLRATSGWETSAIGEGLDEFGFNAEAAGTSLNGRFSARLTLGAWWTSDYVSTGLGTSYNIVYNQDSPETATKQPATRMLPIRCYRLGE